MADLLLELFSEEIPARMQAGASEELARRVETRLRESRLAFGTVERFVTPRRLAVRVKGLAEEQPDLSVEKKGPKVGAPQAAVDGFCRSVGMGIEQLEQRDVKGETLYFAVQQQRGQKTISALPALIEACLKDFPWPKSMRWGAREMTWVRPLRRILCLLESEVVPVTFGHLEASNVTEGHRFLAPGEIRLSHPRDYEDALRKAFVVADAGERRKKIATETASLAAKHGGTVRQDEKLLDEVTGLVEWPSVFSGEFEAEYLSLPAEVLVLEMRHHQKYFAMVDNSSPLEGERTKQGQGPQESRGGLDALLPPPNPAAQRLTPPQGGSGKDVADGQGVGGVLMNRFLMVANLPAANDGAAVIHGNQRVLRARLEDGRFFWDQDRKTPLAEWAEKLEGMLFHAKLGSMGEKVSRLTKAAAALAAYVPGAEVKTVERAAAMAKADLVTGMVGEFPELQGVMGRYYAAAQGEAPAVADAIRDHYKPVGAEDDLPTEVTAVCVALADKLDSLIGLFAAGEKPTGSKDPFALRRAALGIIRIVLENGIRLPLRSVIGQTIALFPAAVLEKSGQAKDALVSELLLFFAERLKVMLKDQGIRHDLITAVFERGDEDDLVRLVARARALQDFVGSEDGANLLTAYRRAGNIVAKEEKKDGKSYAAAVDVSLLAQDEEKTLHAALQDVQPKVEEAMRDERYGEAMQALAQLRAPVDRFFDAVTVNADDADLRANRLTLLSLMGSMLDAIARFDKIES